MSSTATAPVKSLIVTLTMSTTKANVSPVIDLKRINAFVISNRLNNPTVSSTDTFNGDGSTTVFTLTQVPSASNASNFIVFVDNVYQRYGSSYAFTVNGATLTFTSAPPSGTNNIQVIQLTQQNTLNTVADGAITQAKLSFDPADDATALAIALG